MTLDDPMHSSDRDTRRRHGQGGIETDKARGMYRGNYHDAAAKRVRLPWCRTREDAEQQLQAALEMMAASGNSSVGKKTLRSWGEDFLEKRELEGHRAAADDANRWKHYILAADFIDWPLESITRRDVKRWMEMIDLRKTLGRGARNRKKKAVRSAYQPLAWQTKKHALVLLRKAFDRAIDDEVVSIDFANPCFGLKFKRPPTTKKKVNFLTRAEIERVQEHAALHIRPIIEFAIATGMRQGEVRALRDEDVHLDAEVPYVTVRYGKPPFKPTKSGEPRDIPLLPMAQRALEEWYALRKTWCSNNYKGLTFPAERGGYRSAGKILGREHIKIWKALMAVAGIHRHLVWHDLRHTCATALLAGYFGQKWRLEEIQQMLGHAEIETTQLYAHALQTTLNEAARVTTGDIKPRKKS